uniref:Transmembrane protein n=1 Tax=uncultured marine group II/III euryarchaeote KM3_195_B08 TaxID=1457970 RepID=A0A075GSK2_9EURY|nr:hypothetical protein [uncultured marine group II/III euryarchaeote KM3_195_B08]
MGSIKNLLLKFFALFFLTGACVLFFSGIILYKLPWDFKDFKTEMNEQISEIAIAEGIQIGEMDIVITVLEVTVNAIHSYYLFAFTGFLLLFLLSIVCTWLVYNDLGRFIRKFSKYNLMINIQFVIFFIVFWILGEVIFSGIIKSLLLGGLVTQDISQYIDQIVGWIIGWMKNILELPFVIYFVLCALSALGMVTGFGFSERKIEEKKEEEKEL